MRVGARRSGRALMVLGLDRQLDSETTAAIASMHNIFSARTARL
jgi:hypothetical protein